MRQVLISITALLSLALSILSIGLAFEVGKIPWIGVPVFILSMAYFIKLSLDYDNGVRR